MFFIQDVSGFSVTQIIVTFPSDWPVSGRDIIGISNGSADMADRTTIALVTGQLTLGLVS